MKTVKPYELLSRFYSKLMREINYDAWANYIEDILFIYNVKPVKILELGAGNGKLAGILSQLLEKEILISDLSKEMLLQASENQTKIVCDMRALPFGSKFDLIFSCFDSVNYLLHKKDLLNFFVEVSNILSEDGLFLFDVSLIQNSLRHAKSFNITEDFGEIKYAQKSVYNKRTGIHTNEFKIEIDGKTYREKHAQRIYPFSLYFKLLEKAGMYASGCHEAFTFKDANSQSERAQFVVRKYDT